MSAYGAGLLSSFGEMEYACAKTTYDPSKGIQGTAPVLRPFDPEVAGVSPFPITCYQPQYFVADSISQVKDQMRAFCNKVEKPFLAKYDVTSGSIEFA